MRTAVSGVDRCEAAACSSFGRREYVPEFARELADDHWTIRRAAAVALGNTGMHARGTGGAGIAIPSISQNLDHSNSYVRESAANCLKQLSTHDVWGRGASEEAKLAIPELAKRLADFSPFVRKSVREPLQKLRASGSLGDLSGLGVQAALAPASPELVARLENEDWRIKEAACKALGDLGTASVPGAPTLVKCLADSAYSVRKSAKIALEKLCTSSAVMDYSVIGSSAVYSLSRRLKHEDWHVRCAAAWGLGNIGPAAAIAPYELVQLMQDSDWCIRLIAVETFGSLGLAAAPAIKAIADRLYDDEIAVREAAAETVQQFCGSYRRDLGAAAAPALWRIVRKLGSEDEYVRLKAVTDLGELGVGATPAIPWLVLKLTDSEKSVQGEARKVVDALYEQGAFGGFEDTMKVPPAARLVKIVENDDNWAVRLAAAEALATLTVCAALVIPDLLNMHHDEDQGRKMAVRKIMKKLTAAGSIVDLGAMVEMAVPELMDRFLDGDKVVHSLSSEALRKLQLAGLLVDLDQRLEVAQKEWDDESKSSYSSTTGSGAW